MRFLLIGIFAFTAICPAFGQIEIGGLRSGDEELVTSFTRRLDERTDSRSEALSDTAQSLLAELFQAPPNRTVSIARDLAKLQDSLTRRNELEEAVAIRDALREFFALQNGTQSDPGVLSAFRGQNGKSFSFFVTGRRQGSVWGSGVYTDDSALSSVAVHAGLLADGEAGVVRVTIRPGQEGYEGTERNGVISQPYGSFGGSYTVAAGLKTKPHSRPKATQENELQNVLPKAAQEILSDVKEQQNRQGFKSLLQRSVTRLLEMQRTYARAGKLDQALAIKDAAFELLVILYDAIPVPAAFTEFRDEVGQSAYFVVKGSKSGSVWGSGTYTDDSSPGAAAVHAGLLRPGQKGIMKVTLLPGLDSYEGSSRNGVTSQSYANWQGSYRLEGIPEK
jgi:hypothetical protein